MQLLFENLNSFFSISYKRIGKIANGNEEAHMCSSQRALPHVTAKTDSVRSLHTSAFASAATILCCMSVKAKVKAKQSVPRICVYAYH